MDKEIKLDIEGFYNSIDGLILEKENLNLIIREENLKSGDKKKENGNYIIALTVLDLAVDFLVEKSTGISEREILSFQENYPENKVILEELLIQIKNKTLEHSEVLRKKIQLLRNNIPV